jgi:hypothetical protein
VNHTFSLSSRSHRRRVCPDYPTGFSEDKEQEAESKMVTASVRITVVDGEVIPVETTPTKPPPLPEPPPFTIGFSSNYYHTDTTENHFDWNNVFNSNWYALSNIIGINTGTYTGDIEKNTEDSHRCLHSGT